MSVLKKTVKINGMNIDLSPVFYSYWEFAAERQNIFFKRITGSNAPQFTEDKILQEYKFTNTYRASDRVSQYLIRHVIYSDDCYDEENVFFRIMLFKLFNKVETWQLLESELGDISLSNYNFDSYNKVLTKAIESGSRIYSAAYIMPSAGRAFGYKYKHENHLKLIEFMLQERFPIRLSKVETMEEAYSLMLTAPSIGPFLAYQLTTDINYSTVTNFSELEFVKAGPGALDGISKCFVEGEKLNPVDVIKYMASNQEKWFERVGVEFQSLWGRKLQLIDCQNLFCEISKYARVAHPNVTGVSGRTRIKQKYQSQGISLKPWYPPKWGINDKIGSKRNFECQVRQAEPQQASAVQYTLL